MINLDTLAIILRQIAVSFPETDYGRINSFALVKGFTDLDKENFGASYRAGQIGHYWGRSWDAGGNNPDNICAEFNLLFVNPYPELTIGCRGDFSQKISIGVVVPQECEDCEQKLLKHETETRATTLLSYVLTELKKVVALDIGGGEHEIFFDGVRQPDSTLMCYEDVVPCTQRTVKVQDYGANDMTVATTDITLEWCDNAQPVFNYSLDANTNEYPLIKCKTC